MWVLIVCVNILVTAAIVLFIYRTECSDICPETAWVTVNHLWFMSLPNEWYIID